MKFYSQITSKPNSIMKEVKDGNKVIDRKCLCTFYNGELETDDPEVIQELEARPDLFKTDGPWKFKTRWEDTPEGEELLKKAEKLGIDTRHARKEFLESLISEKEQEANTGKLKPDKEEKELSYKEVVAQAKEAGIPTYKRKKEEIWDDLTRKEVM